MTETITEPRQGRRLRAADTTGQKLVALSDVALDLTVGELIDGLLPRMNLQRKDSSGRSLEYALLLPREGKHVRRSETVGEALREDDEVVLMPNVDAGRGREG